MSGKQFTLMSDALPTALEVGVVGAQSVHQCPPKPDRCHDADDAQEPEGILSSRGV